MEQIRLDKLAPHPALATFPLLDAQQMEVLTRSVAEHGILKPLVAIRGRSGEPALVIDGRNRLQAAQNNLLGSVPVEFTADDTDPIVYAIESAIAGRNLTRSGIVLLLVEQHPTLASERENRRANGLKTSKNPNVSRYDKIITESFSGLADRYNVPFEYFSRLLSIRDGSTPEEWAAVRASILSGESSIAALYAGLGGKLATKGKCRKDPDYSRLLTAATATVSNAFKAWGKIKFKDDKHLQATENNIHEMLKTMPDLVRGIAADVIVCHWPDHEKAALLKKLKSGK